MTTAVLAASVLSGWAQSPPAPAPAGTVPPPTPRAAQQRLQPPGLPGLKEEQKNHIFEYNQAIGKARRDHEEDLTKAKKALADAIFAPTTDLDAVRARMADLSKVETEIQVARAQAFAKLRPILTPEQIESIKSNFDDGSRQRIQSTVGLPFPKADMPPGAKPLPPGGLPPGANRATLPLPPGVAPTPAPASAPAK